MKLVLINGVVKKELPAGGHGGGQTSVAHEDLTDEDRVVHAAAIAALLPPEAEGSEAAAEEVEEHDEPTPDHETDEHHESDGE